MPKRKFSELKVGIFVSIAAVIVIATIFWAKGFTSSFNQRSLVVYFNTVAGLNEGDPVTVKGVRMGKVNTIELAGDSVRVHFDMDENVAIKTDYSITVGMAELMGGKVIYIDPGKNPAEINYNQPLFGTNSTDFTQVLTSFGEITSDVKKLLNQFNQSAEKLDIALVNINDIVGDGVLKRDLRSTLSNLEVTSRNLNQLVSENRVELRQLTGKVGNTVDNLDVAVIENSREMQNTLSNIQSLTVAVDTLTTNLTTLVNDVKEQRSGLGKFIYDEKFFNNLNQTVKEIERLTKSIRRDGVKIDLDLF